MSLLLFCQFLVEHQVFFELVSHETQEYNDLRKAHLVRVAPVELYLLNRIAGISLREFGMGVAPPVDLGSESELYVFAENL